MRIEFEICFVEPCDVDGAVAALREHGYEIDKIHDRMADPMVEAIFVYASRDVTADEISADEVRTTRVRYPEFDGPLSERFVAGSLVLDESRKIVAPYGGDPDNAG
jgi:hypothetical protein